MAQSALGQTYRSLQLGRVATLLSFKLLRPQQLHPLTGVSATRVGGSVNARENFNACNPTKQLEQISILGYRWLSTAIPSSERARPSLELNFQAEPGLN